MYKTEDMLIFEQYTKLYEQEHTESLEDAIGVGGESIVQNFLLSVRSFYSTLQDGGFPYYDIEAFLENVVSDVAESSHEYQDDRRFSKLVDFIWETESAGDIFESIVDQIPQLVEQLMSNTDIDVDQAVRMINDSIDEEINGGN